MFVLCLTKKKPERPPPLHKRGGLATLCLFGIQIGLLKYNKDTLLQATPALAVNKHTEDPLLTENHFCRVFIFFGFLIGLDIGAKGGEAGASVTVL